MSRTGKNHNAPGYAWIHGFKPIADYLNIGTTMLQVWRKKYGLPVYKGPAGKPIVIKEEIEQWLREFAKLYPGLEKRGIPFKTKAELLRLKETTMVFPVDKPDEKKPE